MDFNDFNIDLYEDDMYSSDGGYESPASWNNSSTSIVCATLTNVTEKCNYCTPTTVPNTNL